jgi:hypothetical protein
MGSSLPEDRIDALYVLPLGEFVPARKRLADELKMAGNVAEARRVNRLAKPTLSAWFTNQTVRGAPALVQQLVAATQTVAATQRGMAPTSNIQSRFREALAEQRRLVDRLVEGARSLVSEGEPKAAGRILERVEKNLSWGPLSASDVSLFEAGRLTADVAPPGFGALIGAEVPSPGAPGEGPPGRSPTEPAGEPTKGNNDDRRQARAQARAAAAERRSKDLQAAQARANLRRSEAATARARTALDRCERAREERAARVEEAARALEHERAALAAAEAACLEARRALDAQEKAESDARREL